jgi:hypothetical protein
LAPPKEELVMDWKLELVKFPSRTSTAKAFMWTRSASTGPRPGSRRPSLCAADPAGLRLLDRARQGITGAAPGSVEGLQLVVKDIEAAGGTGGPRPDTGPIQDFPWGRFIFADPDGNRWAVQQLPPR